MTEGIIQKVIAKYKQRVPYWQHSTFELLEQELIREIRNYWKKCNDKKMYQELREIIGDSKE